MSRRCSSASCPWRRNWPLKDARDVQSGHFFVLGDSERVLPMTRSLVLNPFLGYPESDRNILDPLLEERPSRSSRQIDGAFIIRGDGVVLAAGVQLLLTQPAIVLPKGLGTRHAAAAATTASTNAVAVAISQSTGTVTIFREGSCLPAFPGDRMEPACRMRGAARA